MFYYAVTQEKLSQRKSAARHPGKVQLPRKSAVRIVLPKCSHPGKVQECTILLCDYFNS